MESKTILIVDDNPTNLFVTSNILEEFDVVVSSNANEALEVLNTELIDLILLDVMMPDIDGFSLCEMIKSNPKTSEIPIIFLTAKNDKESVEKGYALGAVDYVVKPFFPKELLAKVNKHLTSNKDVIQIEELIKKSFNLKVLLIENNMDDLEQFLHLLEKFFGFIDIALDVDEGLKLYKSNSKTYDLVISNIKLHKSDGLDFSKSILEINKDQIIILVSEMIESKLLEEMLHIGVSYFLYKPVLFNNFIQILSKALIKIDQINFDYEKLNEIQKLNHELDSLIDSFDRYVIASRTDLKGNITYASKAYETISGYTKKELIGKPHNIVRHPDMAKSAFENMWDTIKSGKLWVGEVKNLRKDGSFYWVKASVAPYFDKNNNHIGYSAIRLDITAQKELEILHKSMENLLNSVAQGFLSFNSNFKINPSYSKECLAIFEDETFASKSIDHLLFGNDPEKMELFDEGIQRLFDEQDVMIQELFLSLLPNEHIINNKYISIEYKLLENFNIMVVLTDITKNKKLQENLEEQQKIQNMIVSVVTNKEDFVQIKEDFEDFIINTPISHNQIKRELHTFKGIFSQKGLIYTPQAIHDLESQIDQTNDPQKSFLVVQNFHLEDVFGKDLQILNHHLNDEFTKKQKTATLSLNTLEKIESTLKNLSQNHIDTNISQLLHEIDMYKYESVYDLLNEYPIAIKHLASKHSKMIYPLVIKGDKNIFIHNQYKPFFKSLIHIFNNCIDHGIEDMETRAQLGKDEIGTIDLYFSLDNNDLKLTISDNGNGIDTDKLILQAMNKNIITNHQALEIDTNEILMFIFADDLSTKDTTTLTSGRGMGMAAIKSLADQLNIEIKIINRIGQGVEFIFIFNNAKGKICLK